MSAEQADTGTALSDLTRWIAILAAPHGYIVSARMVGGIGGDRLLLQARRRTAAEDEYVQEVSLKSLDALGASAVGSAFDRAARAAFASVTAESSGSAPDIPGKSHERRKTLTVDDVSAILLSGRIGI